MVFVARAPGTVSSERETVLRKKLPRDYLISKSTDVIARGSLEIHDAGGVLGDDSPRTRKVGGRERPVYL